MLHAVEVTAGAIALLVLVGLALFVAVTYTRRRVIAHGADVVVCGMRPRPDARWRVGLLKFSTDLQWYPLLGVTPRPQERWMRRTIDLGTPLPMEPDRRLSAVLDKVVRVPAYGVSTDGRGMHFEVGLGPAPYTALRAWVEASPPDPWPV